MVRETNTHRTMGRKGKTPGHNPPAPNQSARLGRVRAGQGQRGAPFAAQMTCRNPAACAKGCRAPLAPAAAAPRAAWPAVQPCPHRGRRRGRGAAGTPRSAPPRCAGPGRAAGPFPRPCAALRGSAQRRGDGSAERDADCIILKESGRGGQPRPAPPPAPGTTAGAAPGERQHRGQRQHRGRRQQRGRCPRARPALQPAPPEFGQSSSPLRFSPSPFQAVAAAALPKRAFPGSAQTRRWFQPATEARRVGAPGGRGLPARTAVAFRQDCGSLPLLALLISPAATQPPAERGAEGRRVGLQEARRGRNGPAPTFAGALTARGGAGSSGRGSAPSPRCPAAPPRGRDRAAPSRRLSPGQALLEKESSGTGETGICAAPGAAVGVGSGALNGTTRTLSTWLGLNKHCAKHPPKLSHGGAEIAHEISTTIHTHQRLPSQSRTGHRAVQLCVQHTSALGKNRFLNMRNV